MLLKRHIHTNFIFSFKQVGEERISGFDLAERLMNNENILHWLPPLILDKEIKEKYFSLDKVMRKHISTPLFMSLAFWQTFINRNNEYVNKVLMVK